MAVLVLENEGRKRLIVFPESWPHFMTSIRRFLALPDLTDDQVKVLYKPDWCDEHLEVDPDAIQEIPDRSELKIVLDRPEDVEEDVKGENHSDSECGVPTLGGINNPVVTLPSPQDERIQISVSDNTGERTTLCLGVRPLTHGRMGVLQDQGYHQVGKNLQGILEQTRTGTSSQ